MRPLTPVLKYYLYEASVSFGFFAPIFTLFLVEWGELSYTAIAGLSIVSTGLSVVGEIPTGYVGDRFGRRNSLLASQVCMTLSILGFALVSTYLGYVALYALWAGALTFRSGSADAWLYDTLAAEADTDEGAFVRVRGRGGSVRQGITVVTMLAGAALYGVDPRLPFVASAALNGAGIFVLATMPKNPVSEEETLGVSAALSVLREQFTAPPLRGFLVYLGLFFGVVAAANTYVQPITVKTLGVPPAALGLLYAGFTGVSAIASYVAGPVADRFGAERAVLAFPALLGGLLVAAFLSPLLAFPAFILLKGTQSLVTPLASGYVNDHAGSAGRATVLSAASMAYGIAKLPIYVAAGRTADVFSPLAAYALVGSVLLAGCVVFAVAVARRE